jgi:hypothetical protein
MSVLLTLIIMAEYWGGRVVTLKCLNMLSFYKKIFKIFCRTTNNPAGGVGNHPENMAFVGTSVLCIFNLITVYLVVKVFIFWKYWAADDKIFWVLSA